MERSTYGEREVCRVQYVGHLGLGKVQSILDRLSFLEPGEIHEMKLIRPREREIKRKTMSK